MTDATIIKAPPIGQHWPEQGGIYAGLVRGTDGQPDHHLILATVKLDTGLAWQPAIDWAATVEVDGHKDFMLPTRRESAVLFANLQDQFEPRWHWTSEQYSRDDAWVQYFDDGYQIDYDESYEGRARAVRRFNVQSLIHSTEGAAS